MVENSNFILRRYDKAPHLRFVVGAYREQVESVPFEVDGVTACTLFIHHSTTRDLAVQKGWKDETEQVKSFFSKPEPEVKTKPQQKRGRPRKNK